MNAQRRFTEGPAFGGSEASPRTTTTTGTPLASEPPALARSVPTAHVCLASGNAGEPGEGRGLRGPRISFSRGEAPSLAGFIAS